MYKNKSERGQKGGGGCIKTRQREGGRREEGGGCIKTRQREGGRRGGGDV